MRGGRRHFRRYVLTVARREMLMKQRKKKNRNPVARALRSRHLRRRVIPSARAYSRKGVRRYDDDERQQQLQEALPVAGPVRPEAVAVRVFKDAE